MTNDLQQGGSHDQVAQAARFDDYNRSRLLTCPLRKKALYTVENGKGQAQKHTEHSDNALSQFTLLRFLELFEPLAWSCRRPATRLDQMNAWFLYSPHVLWVNVMS